MGFDIECIIDIQKYPGEYFCPVCRTLVYPNEALQSQCTHLYCKPCLAHIANNTRACPYDGYLVTEADSKPLIESDKALAENIGKVKVRCLYHRSGCTWEGPLSECTPHCSGCAFGNSPVICNRCGIQIVHRQVHDHAQSCPGVYQVHQAADAAQVVASSGSTATTGVAKQNQASSQTVALTSQAQHSQSAPAPLAIGQDSNQQANANSQATASMQSAVPNTEHWYQQQYQQYYQQYAGYDPYQQAYPQYYPYQQVAAQQHQQHPPQVLGQQPQLQVYAQAGAQMPAQPSSQPQIQPQTQPQPQHPGQPLAQPPPAAQPVQSQIKTQAQALPHGATPIHSQVQQLASQNQSQVQVNPQQPLHPAMQSHTQIPSQVHSVPGYPATQTQHYAQAQPQFQPQPHPVQPQPQHVQAHYQQPHLPMHHPQPSQVHFQSHMLTATQPQPQLQPQPQPQIQLQPQLQPHLQPTLPNQPNAPSAQPPPLHSSGHAVSGYQSYLQLQPPQQQPFPTHPASGSLPPGQMQGQVLPQPPLVRPSSQVPVPNQQQAQFPSQGQVSGMTPAQQQQFHPQTPQLGRPNQQRAVIHSSQQSLPQQYAQQTFPNSVQSQSSHHNLVQQQSQLRPQGPPHMMQQSSNAYPQLQQNVASAPGVQPLQPHNYVERPVMPNQGPQKQLQPFAQSASGYVTGAQVRPGQFGPYQHAPNQNYLNKTNNQLQTASDQQLLQSGMTSTSGVMLRQGDNVSEKKNVVFEAGLPSQTDTEKVANASRVDSVELKPIKSDVGMSYEQETTREGTENSKKSESLVRDADSELHGRIDGSGQPVGKLPLKEERIEYSLEHSSDIKSNEAAKQRDTVTDVRIDDIESHKGQKESFIKAEDESSQANTGHVNQQKSAGPPILQSVLPVGLQPQNTAMPVRPQGTGLLPQPRPPLNSSEQFQAPLLRQPHDVSPGGIPASGSTASFGRGPVSFGAPQGPPLTALPPGSADPRGGIMGRVPQHGPEGQFGLQHSVNPVEAEMLQKQKQSHFDGEQPRLSGSFERGPFGHPSGVEPNALRMNGGPGFEKSSLGSQDERFKALPGEPLNPFMNEPTWPRDQGSRPLDRAPPGLKYDAGMTLDSAGNGPASRGLPPFHPSGGPGMVRHDMEHLIPRSPDSEYLSRKAHSFGEGSIHNLPLDPQGNRLHENRFLPLPGYPHRGDRDGPEGLRFGEHGVPGPHDHHRRADLFGQDIPPSHFRRGELLGSGNSPRHFSPFPGHNQMGELSGPANLPHKLRYGEPFPLNKQGVPRLGEPGFRSSFSLQGFPNDGPYAGDMFNFDNSRKRKNMSMGWCRICQVDCETVERLEMHSQTGEHQKMSMDIVMSIKQQNRKKFKASNDRAGHEVGSKKRNIVQEGRGKKP